MRDPITRKIPDEAFVWPDTQVLNLGSLSLTSDSEIEAAKRLLGSLDLSGMLRKIRKRIADRTIPDLPKRSSGAHSEHPIRVSVIGLESSKHLQNTSKLYSPIINPEEVLFDYSKEIQRRFLESGLMHLDPFQTLDPLLHMPILRTDRLHTKEPKTKPSILRQLPEGKVLYKRLRIDTEDLYTKYKNFVWANDLQLERLSIREMGLLNFERGQSKVGQGHREIASVPLPGISHVGPDPEMEDISFTSVRPIHNVDPSTIYDVISR